jgi:predicted MPP superfamily phosphohydrolase
LAVTAAGLGAYAWRIEPHWLEVVRRDLPVAHLPEPLVGRTLLQISDIHVGPVVDSDYLIASLRTASALRADLTVITGDFMTCRGAEQVDSVARVLEHLDPGPLGCFAILGNHDYGLGWSNADVAERLLPRLAGLGIHVLRNDCETVAGLQIVGVDDLWGPCFHPEVVMPMVPPDQPALVLCHNPDAMDRPVWSGYKGWILSGHTHGGQCKPPFLPPPLLPVSNPRYTSGEIDLGDGRRLYINRGLGYLRRVRFNVRPEVTLFRLQRA